MIRLVTMPASVFVIGCAEAASAGVIEFEDWDAWTDAVGAFTTIDFTGFADNTPLTDQFIDDGVLFTDVDDFIVENQGGFVDGFGAFGGHVHDEIRARFLAPQLWIAVDFPGTIWFQLFRQGDLVYESGEFGGSGVHFFAGLLTDEPFDEAYIVDFTGTTSIDNLYFGPAIPGPPSIALLLLAGVRRRRRRRPRLRGSFAT